jgi:hypothetical protein
MSMPMYDPRASDLIDALKRDLPNFVLSNHILKKHSNLKAVYAYYRLREKLIEFARNPNAGFRELGPRPRPPTKEQLEQLDQEEQNNMMANFEVMLRLWEDQRRAMTMHVPIEDLMMIDRYMEPFDKVFAATSSIKGLRFKAFTKDVEHPDPGMLGNLLKRNQQ